MIKVKIIPASNVESLFLQFLRLIFSFFETLITIFLSYKIFFKVSGWITFTQKNVHKKFENFLIEELKYFFFE